MSKTYLIGKDAALEDSIARLQSALADNHFNIIEQTWENPAPHVWWVHIRDADAPMNADFVHYPNERWFRADDRGLDAALAEGLLDVHLAAHYDPEKTLTLADLVDINSGYATRGVCAIPFVRQSDQQPVWIPMNIIGNLYVSNGMSAGNSQAEARTQALAEIFERYVKNKIIAEGIALPLIPETVLARHPKMVEAMTALQAEGYLIHAFDASLGGQFPVIAITLLNRENGGCFASFGAHPSFAVALERTVTELLQGRSIKAMDTFAAPSFDNELVADVHNLETHFIDSSGLLSWDLYRQTPDFAFVDWDFSADTRSEFDFLMTLFQRLQAEVYIADYTHLGVYACRVIVPGISEIYPVQELTQYNNNVGVTWRDTILALPGDASIDYTTLLNAVDALGLDDSELVRQVFGFLPDADSAWYSLRLGEMRCLLLLALGEHEEALDMAEWVVTFGASTLSPTRARFYACMIEQLQLALDDTRNADDYAWVQRQLYGESIYQAACAHVAGRQKFYDLPPIDDNYQCFHAHRQLLMTYEKLQAAKQLAHNAMN